MPAAAASTIRAPYVGLIVAATVLFGLAMGHTVLVLLRHFTDAREAIMPTEVAASVAMGLIGWAMVWHGRRRGEAVGTWLGYIAGSLIWTGWFELAWKVTAHVLKVPMIDFEGTPVLNAELQVIQASVVPFLAVLFFYYVNKETRCNAVLWIRRQTKMDPGQSVTGKERNFAALTAFEVIAVTWACYLITIFLVDPRLVGNPMTVTAQLPFLAITIWGVYLLTRLLKHKHFPAALRYAVPAVNVLWIGIEAGSRMKIYPEIWVKPLQFPVLVSLIGLGLIATLAVIRRNAPDQSQPA